MSSEPVPPAWVSTPAATEALLREAEDALRSFALRAIGVSPWLKKPYTDMPEQSPWTMSIGPQGSRAYELAARIRKHLGIPHQHASRALGYPPLDRSTALRAAVADLHMAGIKTGEQYEQLASEVIGDVYRSGDTAP